MSDSSELYISPNRFSPLYQLDFSWTRLPSPRPVTIDDTLQSWWWRVVRAVTDRCKIPLRLFLCSVPVSVIT